MVAHTATRCLEQLVLGQLGCGHDLKSSPSQGLKLKDHRSMH
jgi:hypothetical protein